ncbi:restriction endonuclease [Luteimonas deserti]|uniref:Restriction endonuclease n=1 Tax=Luteimonas deserti TaxID=2752306 RepID=A0A7Z0QSH2_9GAMM|nr:restriction endonuclease [Luteimonas deserti]NYZ63314.1 restriction endonuclease [Luteimonas deserti]
MSQWLVAIGVALAIGTGATLYFHTIQRRRDETAAGIVALSAISWRGFIGMVLQALQQRGFVHTLGTGEAIGDTDYVLEHADGRWLLSCKHGATFVLGRNAVQALSSDMLLKGATGGLLVTQGRIDDEARRLAGRHRIELLDGEALWPELRDLMPAGDLAEIHSRTGTQARRRILLGWLLALLAGVATYLAMPAPRDTAPRVTPTTAAPATQAEPEHIAEPPRLAVETQRADLASAVGTLPWVDRAIWVSASTLQVFVPRTDDKAAVDGICALVLRQPDLTASRIQLTPPPGSAQQTRFLQCRSF